MFHLKYAINDLEKRYTKDLFSLFCFPDFVFHSSNDRR